MKPEEEHIIEKIKRTGYPLEIEASNSLENKRFVVFNTQYYFDEEIQQGRDIDIYALPLNPDPLDDSLLPFRTDYYLPIECKKSNTHSWVFYTRPRIPMNSIYMKGQYETTIPELKTFSSESFEWNFEQKILELLHYRKFERIAIAYDEIKKEKFQKGENTEKGRREIFEATNQLVKFVSYELHGTERRISNLPESLPKRENIIIHFPIIVFDGDMYEASFTSGELKLEETNHVLLSTHFRCPYCKEVRSFTIDVVHRSYFDEYLKLLITHLHILNESISGFRNELMDRAAANRKQIEEETKKGNISFLLK
jgi:effector-binding domain-containing protein